MTGFRWHNVVAGLTMLLAGASIMTAQQAGPKIACVYPAGGKQGTTTQIAVEGQFLNNVKNAYISGGGVRVTVVEFIKPITQRELDSIREQLKDLQNKRQAAMKARMGRQGSQPATRPWTSEDEKLATELLGKVAVFLKARATPAFSETAVVKVEFAPDAQIGQRELRLETPAGLTNPLVFMVGNLPEYSRPTGRDADVQRMKDLAIKQPSGPPEKTETRIELPAVVNGQIPPGGVDRYRFKAGKGQNLVISAAARKLIPYISDAVPGWFQVALAVCDADGNEIGYADHYRFDPDPAVCCKIPKDGEYTVEIRDALYRGRDDFVYRVTIGELPFVTGVFPLGGSAGGQTNIELQGWNLPSDRLTVDYKNAGIYPVMIGQNRNCLSRAIFAADTLPECMEKGGNNTVQTAQKITPPMIVNGRIGKPGEFDVYCFQARAGGKIVAEVSARRLNSPLDSILKLTDAAGKQLAANDDYEDKSEGLYTHQADSLLTATMPADGDYYLHVGDIQGKSGPEYAYRLRVSEPLPDFELIIAPSGINVRAGQTVPIAVYAVRKDGFAGEIALSLKDAPAGFTLGNPKIPAGQDKATLTLTAPRTASAEPVSLVLLGKATIQGSPVVRKATPAEDMMQAFAYRHLVPAAELKAAFYGPPMPRVAFEVLAKTPVQIPAGGTAKIEVGAPKNVPLGEIVFEMKDPPEGLSLKETKPTRDGVQIVIQSDAEKAKPGFKGSLIFSIIVEKAASQPAATQPTASQTSSQPASPATPPAKANVRRIPMGVLPAVSFEIVGKTN
ncbi:MAG: pre-peptidase C-terminal domain-containing protein [Planctomycetes bacterium]|nr:pre-peptidase C-terminal domain-containing protein [Planctomycetota bacterium]